LSGLFGKLRSGASKTAFEAGKIARVRKVEGEIVQIRKQIDAFQERLGEVTYLNYIHKEPQGQDAVDYINQITVVEEQLIVKQEEMKNIQADTYGSSGETSAPGNVSCPNCSKMNSANTKFCSECGTKLT